MRNLMFRATLTALATISFASVAEARPIDCTFVIGVEENEWGAHGMEMEYRFPGSRKWKTVRDSKSLVPLGDTPFLKIGKYEDIRLTPMNYRFVHHFMGSTTYTYFKVPGHCTGSQSNPQAIRLALTKDTQLMIVDGQLIEYEFLKNEVLVQP